MKTINLNKYNKFQDIMKKIDTSSEESYEKSLNMNLNELTTICKENNFLEIIGGAGGFEKEKYISLEHVKKIKNPTKIEYKDVDKIKEKLYKRANRRLDKINNEFIIDSKNLLINIEEARDNYKISFPETLRSKAKRKKAIDRLVNQTKKIKHVNGTIITDEMVGHPIGEIFGNAMDAIFQKSR